MPDAHSFARNSCATAPNGSIGRGFVLDLQSDIDSFWPTMLNI
jgi:hypothetical protein